MKEFEEENIANDMGGKLEGSSGSRPKKESSPLKGNEQDNQNSTKNVLFDTLCKDIEASKEASRKYKVRLNKLKESTGNRGRTFNRALTELERQIKVIDERLTYLEKEGLNHTKKTGDTKGLGGIMFLLSIPLTSVTNVKPRKDGEFIDGILTKLERLNRGNLSFFQKRSLKLKINSDVAVTDKVIGKARITFHEDAKPKTGTIEGLEPENAPENANNTKNQQVTDFYRYLNTWRNTKDQEQKTEIEKQLKEDRKSLIASDSKTDPVGNNIANQKETLKNILKPHIDRRRPKSKGEKRLSPDKNLIKVKKFEEVLIDLLEHQNDIEALFNRKDLKVSSPIRKDNKITGWEDTTVEVLTELLKKNKQAVRVLQLLHAHSTEVAEARAELKQAKKGNEKSEINKAKNELDRLEKEHKKERIKAKEELKKLGIKNGYRSKLDSAKELVREVKRLTGLASGASNAVVLVGPAPNFKKRLIRRLAGVEGHKFADAFEATTTYKHVFAEKMLMGSSEYARGKLSHSRFADNHEYTLGKLRDWLLRLPILNEPKKDDEDTSVTALRDDLISHLAVVSPLSVIKEIRDTGIRRRMKDTREEFEKKELQAKENARTDTMKWLIRNGMKLWLSSAYKNTDIIRDRAVVQYTNAQRNAIARKNVLLKKKTRQGDEIGRMADAHRDFGEKIEEAVKELQKIATKHQDLTVNNKTILKYINEALGLKKGEKLKNLDIKNENAKKILINDIQSKDGKLIPLLNAIGANPDFPSEEVENIRKIQQMRRDSDNFYDEMAMKIFPRFGLEWEWDKKGELPKVNIGRAVENKESSISESEELSDSAEIIEKRDINKKRKVNIKELSTSESEELIDFVRELTQPSIFVGHSDRRFEETNSEDKRKERRKKIGREIKKLSDNRELENTRDLVRTEELKQHLELSNKFGSFERQVGSMVEFINSLQWTEKQQAFIAIKEILGIENNYLTPNMLGSEQGLKKLKERLILLIGDQYHDFNDGNDDERLSAFLHPVRDLLPREHPLKHYTSSYFPKKFWGKEINQAEETFLGDLDKKVLKIEDEGYKEGWNERLDLAYQQGMQDARTNKKDGQKDEEEVNSSHSFMNELLELRRDKKFSKPIDMQKDGDKVNRWTIGFRNGFLSACKEQQVLEEKYKLGYVGDPFLAGKQALCDLMYRTGKEHALEDKEYNITGAMYESAFKGMVKEACKKKFGQQKGQQIIEWGEKFKQGLEAAYKENKKSQAPYKQGYADGMWDLGYEEGEKALLWYARKYGKITSQKEVFNYLQKKECKTLSGHSENIEAWLAGFKGALEDIWKEEGQKRLKEAYSKHKDSKSSNSSHESRESGEGEYEGEEYGEEEYSHYWEEEQDYEFELEEEEEEVEDEYCFISSDNEKLEDKKVTITGNNVSPQKESTNRPNTNTKLQFRKHIIDDEPEYFSRDEGKNKSYNKRNDLSDSYGSNYGEGYPRISLQYSKGSNQSSSEEQSSSSDEYSHDNRVSSQLNRNKSSRDSRSSSSNGDSEHIYSMSSKKEPRSTNPNQINKHDVRKHKLFLKKSETVSEESSSEEYNRHDHRKIPNGRFLNKKKSESNSGSHNTKNRDHSSDRYDINYGEGYPPIPLQYRKSSNQSSSEEQSSSDPYYSRDYSSVSSQLNKKKLERNSGSRDTKNKYEYSGHSSSDDDSDYKYSNDKRSPKSQNHINKNGSGKRELRWKDFETVPEEQSTDDYSDGKSEKKWSHRVSSQPNKKKSERNSDSRNTKNKYEHPGYSSSDDVIYSNPINNSDGRRREAFKDTNSWREPLIDRSVNYSDRLRKNHENSGRNNGGWRN